MPKTNTTTSIQALVDKFKNKILDSKYHPQNAIETLEARMTATYFLVSDDEVLAEKSADFIKRTSTTKEEDLQRLKAFSSSITMWQKLEICSFTTGLKPSVEYKIQILTEEGNEAYVHYQAHYKIENEACVYVSQNKPLIRIAGDSVLHEPGKPYPVNPTAEEAADLARQFKILEDVLVQKRGAGIAANQCAEIDEPYRIIITGVMEDNPAHVQGVAERYPGVAFPSATFMVNPVIIEPSEETQKFKHTCLSTPGPIKCEVFSPKQMTVVFLDPKQNMQQVSKTVKGFEAVVLWHEMKHIIDGELYLDSAMRSLSLTDLMKFETVVSDEIKRRDNTAVIPDSTASSYFFAITINESGQAQLNETALAEALSRLATEVLKGFLQRCHLLMARVAAEKKSFNILAKNKNLSLHAHSEALKSHLHQDVIYDSSSKSQETNKTESIPIRGAII